MFNKNKLKIHHSSDSPLEKRSKKARFDKYLKNYFYWSGGLAELAKASVIHPRDSLSNLSSDRK
jgi:hypothetical protein